MRPIIINAKAMKEDVITSLSEEVIKIEDIIERKPKLVIVNASDDLSSQAYIRNKVKMADEVGIIAEVIKLDETITQKELEGIIYRQSLTEDVDGIILQLPVYPHLKADELMQNITAKKDADCFTKIRLGLMIHGGSTITPCTPAGVIDILKYHEVKLEGSRVTVIGRSTHVGLSLAVMLTKLGAVVTTTHSKSPSIEDDINRADIVISCVGRLDLIQPEWMKKGSVLLGVGINFIDGKQYTDYNIDKMKYESQCSLVGDRVNTTGTATVINLIKNTIELCKERNDMKI